jgi:ketopantoate reductase
MKEKLRYGIVGSGALGGYYGAKLAHAGCDVHFLMRSDLDTVRRDGLTIRSKDGDFHLAARQRPRVASRKWGHATWSSSP